MEDSRLRIEWVPIDRIQLNPANPRVNDDAAPHVAASLGRFGWQQPIVAKRSGEVIAGNTRIKAAISLEMTEVPVVWFDGPNREAVAYSIADNKTSEFAEWDNQSLVQLLEELRAEDALEGVGFDESDLDALLDEVNAGIEEDIEINEDDVPEPPEEPTTLLGDLWILGNHRLLCGDSSKSEDLDRLLDGKPVHLVNTDPPYNVKVEPRSKNAISAGLSSFPPDGSKPKARKLRAKDRPLANDFVSDEEFARLLDAWFGNVARALLPGRGFYIWGGYANVTNYPGPLAKHGLYFSQAIIWDKQHPVLTRKDFMGAHEWCFYGWREGGAHKFFGPNNATDLWAIKKVTPQKMVHLTEKPIELAARAIHYSSRKGENVLDLFGGSGSTLIAAEQTGRQAFLMEIDCPYADVIVTRWETLTGHQAILDVDGRTFAEVKADRIGSSEAKPCPTD